MRILNADPELAAHGLTDSDLQKQVEAVAALAGGRGAAADLALWSDSAAFRLWALAHAEFCLDEWAWRFELDPPDVPDLWVAERAAGIEVGRAIRWAYFEDDARTEADRAAYARGVALAGGEWTRGGRPGWLMGLADSEDG